MEMQVANDANWKKRGTIPILLLLKMPNHI
jgi:hypothetical protein